MSAVELARDGLNRFCVDCGAPPYGGGLRCVRCFQRRVRLNAGQHQSDERPSTSTYSAGCRCRDCKRTSAEYARRRRAKQS